MGTPGAAGERAEATSALARAYLYSDLSPDDLAAAEGAMIMLLDDPSPLVRRVLDACMHERGEQAASLLALLRRFAVEAAREEARLFCDDLVAEACIIQADQSYADAQLVAA